jgi:hypothetical protein
MGIQQTGKQRRDDRPAGEPEDIGRLIDELSGRGLARYAVDAPDDPAGEWLVDLAIGEFETVVGFRPGSGFGIHTSEALFGSRPDEVFGDAHRTAIRLGQLADQHAAGCALRSPGLRDLRNLVEMQQTSVAAAYGGDQAAISRLEARGDHKLSTIVDYVHALGGTLELRVRFDSFEAPIQIGGDVALPRSGAAAPSRKARPSRRG